MDGARGTRYLVVVLWGLGEMYVRTSGPELLWVWYKAEASPRGVHWSWFVCCVC